MCHSPHASVTLQCVDAASEDRAFLDYARRLTRDNMQADYSRHGLVWDDAHFDRHWSETENYLIRAGDGKLGVLRLYLEPPVCYLQDLQVAPGWQRQGLGRWCLHRITTLARARGCRYLRLRAFHDSAAVPLYRRHGLRVVGRDDALVKMEMSLGERPMLEQQQGIRPETPHDACAIEAITVAAFREAPHTDHTEQHIVRALRAAGALSVSLIAERDGEVIGHAAASRVSISDGTPDWFGLGPVSVLPAWQGRGTGSALVEACLARLQARGAKGCVVLGEPEYYARFGFRVVPGLVLPGVPPEYFMALAWGDDFPQGEVTYHPAFAATA